jgi:hypothetical protein
MYTEAELQEYFDELRLQVCSRCVQRPPGGPPCAPLGTKCGIELHLPSIVDAIHAAESPLIGPYSDSVHDRVCSHCAQRDHAGCPCPLDYLLVLAVQAIENVDARRQVAAGSSAGAQPRAQTF